MQNGLETVVISSPGARTAVCHRVGPAETPDSQRYYEVESQEIGDVLFFSTNDFSCQAVPCCHAVN
jgi:hypothetical protein